MHERADFQFKRSTLSRFYTQMLHNMLRFESGMLLKTVESKKNKLCEQMLYIAESSSGLLYRINSLLYLSSICYRYRAIDPDLDIK